MFKHVRTKATPSRRESVASTSRTPFLLLVFSVLPGSCKDAEAPAATTPPSAVREDSIALREPLHEGEGRRQHVEGRSQVRGAGQSSAASAEAPKAESPPSVNRSRWTFDDIEPGKLPDGWSTSVGTWRVDTVPDAPSGSRVLVQRASNRSPVFNVILLEDASHADVDITVQLRARQGRIDQGGGVMWRAQDARNYYVARYNPLEDNYRVYFVKQGRRRQLGTANVRLDHQAWHTLRVTMTGDHIECFLDSEKRLDLQDDTFTSGGMVGLWTKADAQTEFDELEVRAPSRVDHSK